jgi:hypothetical protein
MSGMGHTAVGVIIGHSRRAELPATIRPIPAITVSALWKVSVAAIGVS